MKRVAIGLVLIMVLGSVGFTSYKLVGFIKAKSDNKINSEKFESDKIASSTGDDTSEKEVYNSNENLSESTSNNSLNTTSDSERPYVSPTNNNAYLDVSSPEAFILSYNNLVKDIGSSVSKQDIFSSTDRLWLVETTVGNLVISNYQYNGKISSIVIKGENREEEMRGLLKGEAQVKYENGNTFIFDFNNNDE